MEAATLQSLVALSGAVLSAASVFGVGLLVKKQNASDKDASHNQEIIVNKIEPVSNGFANEMRNSLNEIKDSQQNLAADLKRHLDQHNYEENPSNKRKRLWN